MPSALKAAQSLTCCSHTPIGKNVRLLGRWRPGWSKGWPGSLPPSGATVVMLAGAVGVRVVGGLLVVVVGRIAVVVGPVVVVAGRVVLGRCGVDVVVERPWGSLISQLAVHDVSTSPVNATPTRVMRPIVFLGPGVARLSHRRDPLPSSTVPPRFACPPTPSGDHHSLFAKACRS